MLEEEHLRDVEVRLLVGEREEHYNFDLEMTQAGEVYINDLISTLRNAYEL